jgi:predicted XRE-type DNA-binding protein
MTSLTLTQNESLPIATDTPQTAIQPGSGNVFNDLGLPGAETQELKSQLAVRLALIMQQQGHTQTDAARITGISQPDLSRALRGHLRDFSSDRLIRALNLLGGDIEITVRIDGKSIGAGITLKGIGETV